MKDIIAQKNILKKHGLTVDGIKYNLKFTGKQFIQHLYEDT
jgi:hypothetical protein